jgi:hypothetical protein
MTAFIAMCHILIQWFSFLGIDFIIWLSMGGGTIGDEGEVSWRVYGFAGVREAR